MKRINLIAIFIFVLACVCYADIPFQSITDFKQNTQIKNINSDITNLETTKLDAADSVLFILKSESSSIASDSITSLNFNKVVGDTVTKNYVDENFNFLNAKNYIISDVNIQKANYYISDSKGDDLNDGLTLNTAFKTIQKGIDTAETGQIVLVMAGTYTIDTDLRMTNKNITLISNDGAEKTIITRVPFLTNGISHRLLTVFESPEARISGFTFENGYSDGSGSQYLDGAAGGILLYASENNTREFGAVLSNSIIRNCFAAVTGGGVQIWDKRGMIENSIITGCSVTSGLAWSTLYMGSGLFLRWEAYARNVLVTKCYGNHAAVAIRGGINRLHNLTIVDNAATNLAGGILVFEGATHQIYNTISYYNSPANNYVYAATTDAKNNNTTPAFGTNSITDIPNFVDRNNEDYRLNSASSNIDAGFILDWQTYKSLDLDDAPRINNYTDIGAYEFGGFNLKNEINQKLNKSDSIVITKVSELQNDSNFITINDIVTDTADWAKISNIPTIVYDSSSFALSKDVNDSFDLKLNTADSGLYTTLADYTTNDTVYNNYQTKGNYMHFSDSVVITKLSELINDSNFIISFDTIIYNTSVLYASDTEYYFLEVSDTSLGIKLSEYKIDVQVIDTMTAAPLVSWMPNGQSEKELWFYDNTVFRVYSILRTYSLNEIRIRIFR